MQPGSSEAERVMTLEAFADTIIPGEKRWPDDHAIAGATTGPGAVVAGALEVLETPAVGLAEVLETLAIALNEHARAYAGVHALKLDGSLPSFVALRFAHRTALVSALTSPDHPEKEMWIGLALFSNMAYDSAPHLPTAEALASGHPGLTAMGFTKPDADGLWRNQKFSYGKELARLHPNTTPTGSPA